MKILMSRRGEEFVEAAIVLPLMILTVLSMIMVAVFLYSHSLNQAKAHIDLMREADSSKSVFAVKRKSISTSGAIRGLYISDASKSGSFRAYAIRQADAIRIGALAEGKHAE